MRRVVTEVKSGWTQENEKGTNDFVNNTPEI